MGKDQLINILHYGEEIRLIKIQYNKGNKEKLYHVTAVFVLL
jgi:hypothetical protein